MKIYFLNNNFNKLKRVIKTSLPRNNSGHDFEHVFRVYNLALKIAKFEKNVDLEILKASVLLHDIAYLKRFFKGDHGDIGAKIAKPILQKIRFPKLKIDKVLKAIRLHNFWFHEEKNVSIEIKILRDADRLDSLGYIGIIRAIYYCILSKKDPIKGIENQLILEKQFETKKGEELSKKKIKVIKHFIYNLKKELNTLF